MKKLLLLIVLIGLNSALFAQKPDWHGKKCVVALTYDDGLTIHLDKVIPALDSLGFKGTFYLPGSFPGVKARLADWKKAAGRGHELGNHTLFHPCAGGGQPGREWVNPTYDLTTYNLQRIVDEIRINNMLLQMLDGKTQRTFAFPCGDTMVGGENYYDKVRNEFVAARGVTGEMRKPGEIDLNNVGSYAMNGHSGEQMIELVKQAMATNSVLVFLFHGVGGEHNLNVALPEHKKLLQFLKQHEREIWVAPFVDVAQSIQPSGAKAKGTGK